MFVEIAARGIKHGRERIGTWKNHINVKNGREIEG